MYNSIVFNSLANVNSGLKLEIDVVKLILLCQTTSNSFFAGLNACRRYTVIKILQC